MRDFKKYRPNSVRLKHYDYAGPGEYFVTICTKGFASYFGEINEEGGMVLSEMGRVAEKELLHTEKVRPNVKIDIFQVMPNHVHILLRIVDDGRDTKLRVSTEEFQNTFGPQSRNLGSIVRGYKSAVTKYATMYGIDFSWQANYYEEIIRNEDHYSKVYDYILSNPQTWDRDKNNPNNS